MPGKVVGNGLERNRAFLRVDDGDAFAYGIDGHCRDLAEMLEPGNVFGYEAGDDVSGICLLHNDQLGQDKAGDLGGYEIIDQIFLAFA